MQRSSHDLGLIGFTERKKLVEQVPRDIQRLYKGGCDRESFQHHSNFSLPQEDALNRN